MHKNSSLRRSDAHVELQQVVLLPCDWLIRYLSVQAIDDFTLKHTVCTQLIVTVTVTVKISRNAF